ncbi:MAG: UMP kinase [Candidatus Zixiibacteriota bacterium]|nr:MAG: UMP kinase [candidate division Zixibacteria bacterium]
MTESDKPTPAFRRILLKLSGEAMMGPNAFGIHAPSVDNLCRQIKEIKEFGVEIAVVIGGGNIFRGLSAAGRKMDRVTADNMGMLATVINALALMDRLEQLGIFTRVMSAVKMEAFAEPYIRRRAVRHMEKGRMVILAAGTGNPYFSTDTAASLRAMEVGAEIMIKATNVDGVYSSDPRKDAAAEFYPKLSYMDVLKRELRVMDSTAISLLKDNNIPVRVINIHTPGALTGVVLGEDIGTLITAQG